MDIVTLRKRGGCSRDEVGNTASSNSRPNGQVGRRERSHWEPVGDHVDDIVSAPNTGEDFVGFKGPIFFDSNREDIMLRRRLTLPTEADGGQWISLLHAPTVTGRDVFLIQTPVAGWFPPRQALDISWFLAVAMTVPPAVPGDMFKGAVVPRVSIACLHPTSS